MGDSEPRGSLRRWLDAAWVRAEPALDWVVRGCMALFFLAFILAMGFEATRRHWAFAVGAVVLFGVLIAAGLHDLRHGKLDTKQGVFVIALLGALSLSGFAVISFLLRLARVADYKGGDLGDEVKIDDLAAFIGTYAWHLLDVLPLVDAAKTYQAEPPVRPANLAAWVPVVGFRMMVLLLLWKAATNWWEKRRQSPAAGTDSTPAGDSAEAPLPIPQSSTPA